MKSTIESRKFCDRRKTPGFLSEIFPVVVV